jgi:hypothetical protein
VTTQLQLINIIIIIIIIKSVLGAWITLMHSRRHHMWSEPTTSSGSLLPLDKATPETLCPVSWVKTRVILEKIVKRQILLLPPGIRNGRHVRSLPFYWLTWKEHVYKKYVKVFDRERERERSVKAIITLSAFRRIGKTLYAVAHYKFCSAHCIVQRQFICVMF